MKLFFIILAIVIGIFLMFFVFDSILTRLYCQRQKTKDNKYEQYIYQNLQYTREQVVKYKFPKKQIKSLLHIYKGWIRYKLHHLGNIPCHRYRKFMLRHVYLMNVAKTAVIYGGFEIRAPWKIEIGEGSIIGDECKLDGRNGIVIGKNVNFSTGAWIWTEQHDVNDPDFQSNNSGGKVIIGDRAWISNRTIILPGITIGEGAVIAAGGVVTKDCEAYGIYAGVPVKKIGERNHNLEYDFTGTHEAFW